MRKPADLVVLGAGPAGMSAAIRARALGLDVIVVDEQPAPGGQVWRAIERATAENRATLLGEDYVRGASLVAAFRGCGARYLARTRVWHVEIGFQVFMLCDGAVDVIAARRLIIATGAIERPAPFPGWTLPGVLTIGAAQILLKTAGQVPGAPAWVAGSGPLMLLYLNQLLDVGGRVAGILDTAPAENRAVALARLPGALGSLDDLRKGRRWMARLRKEGVPVHHAVTHLSAKGVSRVEAIEFRKANGEVHSVPAQVLLVHEGVIPALQVPHTLGCAHAWNATQRCFVPTVNAVGESTVPGAYIAGDGAGIGGVRVACASGEIAALAVVRSLGRATHTMQAEEQRLVRERKRSLAIRPFLDALYGPRSEISGLTDDTIVCRCEEVTAGQIRELARSGIHDPNHLKAQTRCGMGSCQGRMCASTLAHLIAQAAGKDVAAVGLYRARPPIVPLTLAQLASLDRPEKPA